MPRDEAAGLLIVTRSCDVAGDVARSARPTDTHERPRWRNAAGVALLVTGSSTIKRLSAAGIDPHEAADRTGPAAAAAVMRHAAAGGRRVLNAAIAADELALSYQRITDEKPCAF